MNKKQNFEKDLFVDFTRSFIHVIKNRFNQEDTHIIEKVLFFVIHDDIDEHTENHIRSELEIEKNTISRNNKNYSDANLQQDFKERRHYQSNIEMNK